jgi:hypothetical protein
MSEQQLCRYYVVAGILPYRVQYDRIVRDLMGLKQTKQPSKLRIHLRQSAQIVGIVLVHVVELWHRRMRLVNRVEAEVCIERCLSGDLPLEEGLKCVDNERRVVACNLVCDIWEQHRARRYSLRITCGQGLGHSGHSAQIIFRLSFSPCKPDTFLGSDALGVK